MAYVPSADPSAQWWNRLGGGGSERNSKEENNALRALLDDINNQDGTELAPTIGDLSSDWVRDDHWTYDF